MIVNDVGVNDLGSIATRNALFIWKSLKKGIRCRLLKLIMQENSGTVLAAVIGIKTSKICIAID